MQYGKFVTGPSSAANSPTTPQLRKAAPQLVVECPAPCLGYSRVENAPVLDIIKAGLPITVSIALAAFVLWIFAGVFGGIVAALTRGRWPDRLIVGLALVGFSLPTFFIGLLLLVFVAIKWQLVAIPALHPVHRGPRRLGPRARPARDHPRRRLRRLYVRLTRAYMIETMCEDYIRTARAKGVRECKVIRRHGLRAALTPIVTAAGLDLGGLLGGAVITEQVFTFHGLGTGGRPRRHATRPADHRRVSSSLRRSSSSSPTSSSTCSTVSSTPGSASLDQVLQASRW